MADQNKRYFWLKLKEGFFIDKPMRKLRKIAGGDTYTIIYIKLMLLSLRDNGRLYFENVEETFAEELALELEEKADDVKITIAYLKRMGLLEEISGSEIFLTQMPESVGSETEKAALMRKMRTRRKAAEEIEARDQGMPELMERGNNVTDMLPDLYQKNRGGNNVTEVLPAVTKCYTEKEIDIDKDTYIPSSNLSIPMPREEGSFSEHLDRLIGRNMRDCDEAFIEEHKAYLISLSKAVNDEFKAEEFLVLESMIPYSIKREFTTAYDWLHRLYLEFLVSISRGRTAGSPVKDRYSYFRKMLANAALAYQEVLDRSD